MVIFGINRINLWLSIYVIYYNKTHEFVTVNISWRSFQFFFALTITLKPSLAHNRFSSLMIFLFKINKLIFVKLRCSENMSVYQASVSHLTSRKIFFKNLLCKNNFLKNKNLRFLKHLTGSWRKKKSNKCIGFKSHTVFLM